jgi:subtilase family serine protease
VSGLLAFGQETQPVWGGAQASAMLTQPIDDAVLVKLHGNTRPEANAANDRGQVADSFRMPQMLLQLRRPAKQQQELDQFIQQLHDPNSPNFHRWLTSREFGERFGLAPEDIQIISGWLQSHGFKLDAAYPNGTVVSFSGTVGQVRQAFHTEIHRLEVGGAKHIANMSDPYIPAALAPAVAGVVSFNDFRPHPMNRPKTDFSVGDGLYLVAPADLATIYNLNPLFAAGYSGQGQTIVVVEDTDVYSTNDWATFRRILGLSGYSSGSFTQVHPAGSGGNRCSDPGVNGDDGEAILDAEWASAAAPSAAIQLASCTDTTVFGGHLALLNLLNGSSAPPAIVSISYGTSESALGAAYNNFVNQLHQQAVAEGVSVFVSSGDQAAAVSDRGAEVATHGINVNGFASTPYNVAVGGTDFGDTYESATSSYWGATNGRTYGSARSYIPEIPWNDSCASELVARYVSGSGITYGSAGFCNSYYGSYLLNVVGGSGGPSGCATGSPAGSGAVGGSCAGYAKPSWQSVFGNPHDGVRDLPDVSLFASNGFWMHYYVVCYSDTNNGGSSCAGTPDTWSGFGGTSISSPIMAAMQALVNQATRGRWGNPNPLYYAIAAAEYGSTGNPNCNSSLGNTVASGCVFYDVTAGDMDVPCMGSVNCYLPSGEVGVLSTSNSAYQPAYAATTGWDFATGIGTVNAYNLVGTAVAIVSPVAKLSAGNLVFGTQLFNTSSAKQSLTLSNVGKNPLVISSLKIAGGNASDFSLSQNCPSSLAAGAACTLSVTFKPTAVGTRNSSIVVTDNAQGSPQSVSLTGSGTVVVLSPVNLSFGSLPVGTTSKAQTVTLSNKGTSALSLSSLQIVGADAADFSKTTTCSTSLTAAKSCTVTVSFKPRAKGARAATLQFSDNGGASPQTVALAGTGS